MDNNWMKPQSKTNGIIQINPCGDRLVSGKVHQIKVDNFRPQKKKVTTIWTRSIKDMEPLIDELPNDGIKTYVRDCLEEHSQVIENLLSLWYEGDELFFRDFLSWPRNEIASHEFDALQEAFKDDRYELVPTIRFANRNLENPADDIAETSSVIIEFHKRGMAF